MVLAINVVSIVSLIKAILTAWFLIVFFFGGYKLLETKDRMFWACFWIILLPMFISALLTILGY